MLQPKKPKFRKTPILIKNVHKESSLNTKTENYNSYQDDLPLGSESGFILPSVKGVTIVTSFTPAILAGIAFIKTELG